jgi:hypothetical protein
MPIKKTSHEETQDRILFLTFFKAKKLKIVISVSTLLSPSPGPLFLNDSAAKRVKILNYQDGKTQTGAECLCIFWLEPMTLYSSDNSQTLSSACTLYKLGQLKNSWWCWNSQETSLRDLKWAEISVFLMGVRVCVCVHTGSVALIRRCIRGHRTKTELRSVVTECVLYRTGGKPTNSYPAP